MKIFYTADFKKCLKNPYKKLSLPYYKLRHGTSTDFPEDSKISTSGINGTFLEDTSPQEGYYDVYGVLYKDTGVQLNIEIPEIDASFYTGDEDYYYQVLIFFYKDLTSSSDSINPAFILFDTYQGGVFSGLSLNTLKNIITIPYFPEFNCSIDLKKSDIVEFMEDTQGPDYKTSLFGSDSDYASREVIELDEYKSLGEDVETLGMGYYETQIIDRYGLKLY